MSLLDISFRMYHAYRDLRTVRACARAVNGRSEGRNYQQVREKSKDNGQLPFVCWPIVATVLSSLSIKVVTLGELSDWLRQSSIAFHHFALDIFCQSPSLCKKDIFSFFQDGEVVPFRTHGVRLPHFERGCSSWLPCRSRQDGHPSVHWCKSEISVRFEK